MMRVVFLAIILIAAAVPAFAEGCERCNGYYDPGAGKVSLSCIDATDNEIGNAQCEIDCASWGGSEGFCLCGYYGDFCMVIVVRAN